MAQTIPIELLQLLEDKLGKEEGRKVASAIEIGLEAIEKKAEAVALQKKLEIKDELTKELATKADIVRLEGEIRTIKADFEGKIETVRSNLEGKIEKLNQKFNFMIILLIIALTLMNPVVSEIIKNLLKL